MSKPAGAARQPKEFEDHQKISTAEHVTNARAKIGCLRKMELSGSGNSKNLPNSPAAENERVLVSVITPFYNREKFLAEAIESVLAQSENRWELILVDDGSTDASAEIAGRYARAYPDKIFYFAHKNRENKGAGASRNLGISKARGEFITFLDSDDVFLSDTLEKELKAFEKCLEADAVCGTLQCWYSWSDSADRREKDFTIDLVLEVDKLYDPPELLIHNLNAGGRKPGINSVMLRSEFVKRVGAFDDEFSGAGEDQVFWAKVGLFGKIYVMDTVLAKYRQHPVSTCASEIRNGNDVFVTNSFLLWLERFLTGNAVTDEKIWKALRGFQKNLRLQKRFFILKRFYRFVFPLYMRYAMRDKWIKLKRRLLRSAHRHK